jgi:hypothetical protein
MITKRLVYDGDADDRLQARIQRQEAARIAAGLPEPVSTWRPPDPTKDIWGKPLKVRKPRKRAFTS